MKEIIDAIAPEYNSYREGLDKALKEKKISFEEWDRKVEEAERALFEYLLNI